jgi:hypothetical protein
MNDHLDLLVFEFDDKAWELHEDGCISKPFMDSRPETLSDFDATLSYFFSELSCSSRLDSSALI